MNSRYEIGFIITPEVNEEEVKKIIESITATIKKAKGVIENLDEWGRKKMAFPIKKNLEGYYVFIQTEVDGAIITTLERRLKQMEKVLRFITLRLDDKLKKSNKLTKKWAKIDKIRKKTMESRSEDRESEDFSEKEEESDADEK
ncbi:MAG: 30S ribosomal protein S6 [Acidobacteria bacterium]|nr:30S ribosomal protein S6 [Acidobacteriota bacterium]MBU4306791.1 30S ribosomal protein S6 [Acidobacteriota bacterium]MCG2811529.1 30S ribosomal protein S6 [Candidatus Aminicenantes bacterium]TFG79783.1 MAG: 30S ribosomal protein S6 [Chrysiogenales bacterium]